MQLGQLLGNATLAGVKTDGAFVVFGTAPADFNGPGALLQGLSILVPVSDYAQFTASSPKIGKPDSDGVSQMADTGLFVASLGSYALMGPATGPSDFAAKAKSIKAGPAKSLASLLDASETGTATREPLWIYANIPALAKALGPGVADKIKKAGEAITKDQGPSGAKMDMKAVFSMYGGMADTLLKEMKSVTVTVSPKPTVLLAGITGAALPGTPTADLLTKPAASGLKDCTLLPYCEDGAFMTGDSRCDMAWMAKVNLKMIDMILPMAGGKVSQDQVAKLKALAQDLPNALGNEMAFTAVVNAQAKPLFSVKHIILVKDKAKVLKLYDQAVEMYVKGGFLSQLYAGMGLDMATDVKRQPDSTYQGATLKSCKLVFSFKDPNSPEAQAVKMMYGDGFEFRVAVSDQLAFITIGADADANVKKLVDQAKAAPGQPGTEIKSAIALLPEAKDMDVVLTLNYIRLLGGILPAVMPAPAPQPSFQTKSDLVFAEGADKGRCTLQLALPKEHLMEIVQAITQMTMQQQQQKQSQPQTGGAKPQGM
jgi:hypothetical protein